MKNLLIFGGSGFIGRNLIKELSGNYNITVVSRNPDKQKNLFSSEIKFAQIDYSNPDEFASILNDTDAIINLAGENVGERWTNKKKQAIKNSRLNTDKFIVSAFNACSNKPEVIIQGSGMGVYGFGPSDEEFNENSPLGANGFLTEVGIAHEKSIAVLAKETRLVYLRTGLVLDGKDGALPQMAMPFKFFGGGPVDNGKQWNSWIHIKDEVRAIQFLLENPKASGAYNLTAPNPVSNKQFAKALGKAMHRPSSFPAPAFFLRLAMGNMADELLLSGVKVIPDKLTKAGFQFQYAHINNALEEIYS